MIICERDSFGFVGAASGWLSQKDTELVLDLFLIFDFEFDTILIAPQSSHQIKSQLKFKSTVTYTVIGKFHVRDGELSSSSCF